MASVAYSRRNGHINVQVSNITLTPSQSFTSAANQLDIFKFAANRNLLEIGILPPVFMYNSD